MPCCGVRKRRTQPVVQPSPPGPFSPVVRVVPGAGSHLRSSKKENTMRAVSTAAHSGKRDHSVSAE